MNQPITPTAFPFPGPDATREEIDAFYASVKAAEAAKALSEYAETIEGKTIPHEAPRVENGPSLVCSACGIVRVGLGTPFCKGCLREIEANACVT